MFQPMALSSWRPCLSRSCRCFFWSPTGRGRPAISRSLARSKRPGIADSVGLELLDLFDDAERRDAERDLGVDHDLALELLGSTASVRQRSSKPRGESRELVWPRA